MRIKNMGRAYSNQMDSLVKQHMFVLCVCLVLFTSACTKSPGGSVEELIKTNPPNFNGQLTATFWSPSNTYQLDGNCDPIGYATQWSTDNSNWTDFAGQGGCPNGTFTLTVNFSARKRIYVRTRTKTGFTATAIATIRLQLPPTSPNINLVNASSSPDEEGASLVGSIEILATSLSDSNGSYIIKSSVVDAAYGQ